ncbi:MAG: glycosyltransferase family 2 protein [Thiohalobacterales bacterium]|nr:glycosyltransferase family 2 protein [Thiohalobacterales bacterium]
MDLSVVIPVFNESECIAGLVDEVCRTLEGALDYEVIVVDDGSVDGTAVVLQECCTGQPRLRVVTHLQRCGQSAALGSGVCAARAERIATLDGDGQNDPADIMKLSRAMDSSAATVMLVTGHRLQRRDSGMKRFASRIANAVRSRLLHDNTPDTGCGIRVFARDTWLGLPQFDHMHRFLPALVQRQGGETLSVVVNHRARQGGVSKYGVLDRLWVGIVDLLGVWWLQRRCCRPVIAEPAP